MDDLRVYADIFESPLQFLHFLVQRELAENSKLVELNDELDHLGLYLKMNNYSRYADELMIDKNPSKIIWDTFTQELDDYYNKLFAEENIVHAKPNQEMPEKIREIINLLEKQEKSGRVRVASFLLDGADDYRRTIENAILRALQRQTEFKRLNSFFIEGEMNIACFCIHQGVKLPNEEWRKDYVKYRLLMSGHDDVLMLIIQFDQNKIMTDVSFDFVTISKVTVMELERIRIWGERMKSSMTTYLVPTSK